MTDVLLTGCWGAVSDLAADNLRAHGLSVAQMPYQQNKVAFAPDLGKALQAYSPAVVMPVFQGDLLCLCAHMLPEGTRISCGDLELLCRLDDKVQASELASQAGIPQPRMYAHADEVQRFPAVFKRAEGLGGSGVYFPKNRQALEKLLATSRRHLIMDYVEGWDWSVDVLMGKGGCEAAFSYKVLEPRGKGFSTLRECTQREDIKALAVQLLSSAGWHGVCGVDFRIGDEDGQPYFLECNPRFSGGLASALEAGVELPWQLYQLTINDLL